jgi:ABC-2 type transport system permease protein
MQRTLTIAWREFSSVVFTRGFLLGIVMTPAMILVAVFAVNLLRKSDGPRLEGRVMVVDRSNAVWEPLASRFGTEADDAETRARVQGAVKAAEELAKRANIPAAATDQAKDAVQGQLKQMNEGARLTIERVTDEAQIDTIKAQLRTTQAGAKRSDANADAPRPIVGLIVISDATVRRQASADSTPTPTPTQRAQTYASPELFLAQGIDFEIQRRITQRLGASIVDARIATDDRVRGAGLSGDELRALMWAPEAQTTVLTPDGQRKSFGELQMLIPAAFMLLLLMSVMVSGQYLLTAVVEEKSSRVMELLLSAVSPMQLMTGKIIGMMCVGLLIMLIYGSTGMAALAVFALLDLVSTWTLVLLMVYFIIAFFTMAAFMAAIGSAVNDMREAQTLMSPVMMIMMVPWLMWFYIQRAPNSTLATVLSFTPFVNPFIMVLRMGGSEPVPQWQIAASIGIGVATVFVTLWAAAKIFRVGVLMFGKPPNFRTLIAWVRMA